MIASGEWWTLDDNGRLDIFCAGDMPNYDGDENWPPWTSYLGEDGIIDTVVIAPGTTSVGDCAFIHGYHITSITIPEGVTYIGNWAFNDCDEITSIILPDSVTYIGEAAFNGCSALTSVTIFDGVTAIGEDAFIYCNRLTNVYYTGTQAQWEQIRIEEGNEDLTSATIEYNYSPDPAHSQTPTITAQPVSYSYKVGATASALSVVASVTDGGTLTYQWYTNSTTETTGGIAISGATSASYTPLTTTAGNTYYYCVITNTLGQLTASASSGSAQILVTGGNTMTGSIIPIHNLQSADSVADGDMLVLAKAGTNEARKILAALFHGNNATINGKPAVEIEAGENISLTQDGTTLTISATGLAAALAALATLIGNDANKSARTIALEELAAQFTQQGAANKGVYISAPGVVSPMTYELNKTVPANAVFTDTTYTPATSSANGLMSSTDKAKLDSIDLPGGGISLPVTLASQSIAAFTSAAGRPIRVTAHIQPVQADGTPSPSNPLLISGWTGVNVTISPNTQGTGGTAYTVAFPASVGSVYGGTLDMARGLLTVTHGQIVSYDGETLPGPWLSSMDVYAPGGTPTTGAQVVYELPSPLTYQLEPQRFVTFDGGNTVWADCGPVTVTHWPGTGTPVEPVEDSSEIEWKKLIAQEIEDLKNAVLAQGGNV